MQVRRFQLQLVIELLVVVGVIRVTVNHDSSMQVAETSDSFWHGVALQGLQ